MGTTRSLSFLSEKDKAAIAMRKAGLMARDRSLNKRREFMAWKQKSPNERLGVIESNVEQVVKRQGDPIIYDSRYDAEEASFLKNVVRKRVAKYKQASDRIRACGQIPSEFNAVRFLRKNEVADFLRWCEKQEK